MFMVGSCSVADDTLDRFQATAPHEEPRPGGTAVIGWPANIGDINPLTYGMGVARQINEYVLFMPLVQVDERLEFAPYLARSWELSPDSTALTFHLRDDVYWHPDARGYFATARDWWVDSE
jgi:ABC-type transport system substrate-binding protein